MGVTHLCGTESDKARLRWWAVHRATGARGVRVVNVYVSLGTRLFLRWVWFRDYVYVSAQRGGTRAIKCVSSTTGAHNENLK